mmetsp:Transcript_31121/g.88259  ORF Transcript_31121/g.88259 Transcript_31121/m.88259 type:complete len:391 (+) Transcript_31121:328-1500(+)
MQAKQFHNVHHAVDTLSRLSAILAMSNLFAEAGNKLKRDLAAVLIACIVTDYEHPGRSNLFQIRSQSPSATRFNGQHVNQNSAVHKCMKILNNSRCNFICNWTEKQQMEFRSDIIHLVLGSDFSSHFELMSRFHMRLRTASQQYSGEDAAHFMLTEDKRTRLLVLQMAMTCAQQGQGLLPPNLHLRWLARLQEEHFSQGDDEFELGLPVSSLMSRKQEGIMSPRNHVGWMDIVVLPAFEQFSSVFSDCEPLLERLRENRGKWAEDISNHSEHSNSRESARGMSRMFPPFRAGTSKSPSSATPSVQHAISMSKLSSSTSGSLSVQGILGPAAGTSSQSVGNPLSTIQSGNIPDGERCLGSAWGMASSSPMKNKRSPSIHEKLGGITRQQSI